MEYRRQCDDLCDAVHGRRQPHDIKRNCYGYWPDAYTSTSHSHGGKIPMPNGQVMTMPDMDMTTTSRRLGPCKPGDRQAPH
jgi:hypothetical protein